jgi:hypothetical protein
MKKLLVALSMVLAMSFTTNSVKAQTSSDAVNNVLVGLLAVNISQVNVDILNDVVVTVDVRNVLNDADIAILTNFLNDNTVTIDNVLNNLLREADIISNNQIVVGVLSGQFLILDQKANTKPRKK